MFFFKGRSWVVASLPMGGRDAGHGAQSRAVLGAMLGASSEVRTRQPRTCPGSPVAAGMQPGLGLVQVQPRGLSRLARHRDGDTELAVSPLPQAMNPEQPRAGCVLGNPPATHQKGLGKNPAPKSLCKLSPLP